MYVPYYNTISTFRMPGALKICNPACSHKSHAVYVYNTSLAPKIQMTWKLEILLHLAELPANRERAMVKIGLNPISSKSCLTHCQHFVDLGHNGNKYLRASRAVFWFYQVIFLWSDSTFNELCSLQQTKVTGIQALLWEHHRMNMAYQKLQKLKHSIEWTQPHETTCRKLSTTAGDECMIIWN